MVGEIYPSFESKDQNRIIPMQNTIFMKYLNFLLTAKEYYRFVLQNKLQHISGFILGIAVIIIFLTVTKAPLPGNIESNDIPNWITLIAEIIVGVTIASFIFKIQSNTDKLRSDVIDEIKKTTMQIDKYVEDKRQLDENTKKFYYDKVKDNLEAIKKADEKAKEIINNIIEKAIQLNQIQSITLLKIVQKSEL